MLQVIVAIIVGILLGRVIFTINRSQPINANHIIDLTKPLVENMEVYHEENYSDPPFSVSPWCDIATQGYCVSRLELGTQTGTHIDAPRHFIADGDTLDQLPAQALAGNYLLIDINNTGTKKDRKQRDASFLFLRFRDNGMLTEEDFSDLLKYSGLVWIVSGKPRVANKHHLEFHRELARAKKYLVEDLDNDAAWLVKPGGMAIVAPLRLEKVSGSPCRVLILQN